ncbi:MAG: hypothetical protein IH848_02300 [Acidobacteria bacterium]|nr:hypothetical protein [Acidobacteriota bacterium]
MKRLTQPDVEWLAKLLEIINYIYADYPEMFSEEEEETLAIARQLIRSLK